MRNHSWRVKEDDETTTLTEKKPWTLDSNFQSNSTYSSGMGKAVIDCRYTWPKLIFDAAKIQPETDENTTTTRRRVQSRVVSRKSEEGEECLYWCWWSPASSSWLRGHADSFCHLTPSKPSPMMIGPKWWLDSEAEKIIGLSLLSKHLCDCCDSCHHQVGPHDYTCIPHRHGENTIQVKYISICN